MRKLENFIFMKNDYGKVVFIKNKCFFRWRIKKHLSKGKKNFYFCLSRLSIDAEYFLAQEGLLEFQPIFTDDDKKQFLKEYVSLMGAVGAEQDNHLWWSTDIASKNRFTSSLEQLLEKLWIVMRISDNLENIDKLFLIGAPWPAERVLRSILKQNCALGKVQDIFQYGYYFIRAVIYKLIYCFFAGFQISWRVFNVRLYLAKKLNLQLIIASEYDVIKSFVFNRSFSEKGAYNDNYFGVLPEILSKKRKVIILAAITADFNECLKKIRDSTATIIVPIEYFLCIKDIWRYTWRIFCYWPKIKSPVLFGDKEVAEILNKELIRNVYKIQLFQLLHYPAIKRMLNKIELKTFILTCENNPWERMCIDAIKEIRPSVKVIGYSHNVIPQASANMFLSQEENKYSPLPDKILTTGKEPKRIMECYGHFPRDSIVIACGLRFQYLIGKPLSQRRPIQNILLALEGVENVRYLIEYALKQLMNHARYRVTIRAHPVLPWSYFVKKYGYNLKPYENFRISDNQSLYEDIENSDVVLYWGTTVALEALSIGKPVIHFDNGSLLSYDPLFRCLALKWKVYNKDSLLKVFSDIEGLTDVEYSNLQLAAKEYLKDYFKDVDLEGLNQFQ